MGLFCASFILNEPLQEAVAKHIPMRRELKVAMAYLWNMSRAAGRKAHPDEKGTESQFRDLLLIVKIYRSQSTSR